MEASDRQAGAIERPGTNESQNGKEGLNSVRDKTERKRCYRCDLTGHTQDDKRCPARSKECLKCHRFVHFAKCWITKNVKKPHVRKPDRDKSRWSKNTQ